jgi:hypothetical protein
MPLSAIGHPLHTRTLSVTLTHADPPIVGFAAYVLDLRKRGFAPVGGNLQGTGVIHHMRLDGTVDRAAGRIEQISAQMPAIAFEASPATRGESCRDLIGRVDHLVGQNLDDSYAGAVGSEIGGPRGCSHVLTLAQLLAPTIRWAFTIDERLHGRPPARRTGERIMRRDVTVDGYEPALGELALTMQLNDLHFAPAPALAQPMQRFGLQTEITASAALTMKDLTVQTLEVYERRRTAENLTTAEWRARADVAAPLVGQSLRAGISARLLAQFADPGDDAPLRDSSSPRLSSSASPPSTSGRCFPAATSPPRPAACRIPATCGGAAVDWARPGTTKKCDR